MSFNYMEITNTSLLLHFIVLKTGVEVCDVIPANAEVCKQKLLDGYLVAISPGGLKEGLFSDSNYNLIWEKRRGFAKVAIATKAVFILLLLYSILKLLLNHYPF